MPRISYLLTLILLSAVGTAPPGPLAEHSSKPSPGPLFGHALCYDEHRGDVILFGGAGLDRVPLGETWIWNGTSWREANATGPSPRVWPAMTYDPVRERVLLFGGRERNSERRTSMGDTWEWNGKRWRRVNTSGPPGRDHHTTAFDRGRGQVILFGGWDGEAVRGDTWVWDGKEWKEVQTEGPEPRAAHAMVYDETRGVVLLFGGRSLEEYFGDTWQWDGQRWTRLEGPAPPRRAFHGLAYDRQRHQVILFGGRDGPVRFADTWVWDGRAWSQLTARGPSERGVYSMVFDQRRKQAVFHGGGFRDGTQWTLYDETWTWSDPGWHKVPLGQESKDSQD